MSEPGFWDNWFRNYTTAPSSGAGGDPGSVGAADAPPEYVNSGGFSSIGGSGDSGGGGGWLNILKSLGVDIGKAALPELIKAGVGAGVGALLPGQPARAQLLDTRQPEARTGSSMALARLQALQNNPMSFGLPGDPNDPSTPAGKRLYGLRSSRRSADAGRGMLETGGSATREMNDINSAIAGEYNSAMNSGFGNLAALSPPMVTREVPKQDNPWAKLIMAAVGPGIDAAGKSKAANKRWVLL